MLIAFISTSSSWAGAEDSAADAAAKRRPTRFAIIFNMGYAGDHLPQDPKSFERLVVGIKKAHFNVVLCKYEPWRAKICKKHGLQIMVDLLAPGHHVYKEVDGAKKLCESLRGNRTVYGYHLWSDNISSTYPGRSRDVKNVHQWDPTHPTYVGSYRMSRVNRVEGLDLLGYYDFHWKRGGHWGNVGKASRVAVGKNAFFLRYIDAAPGRIGAGNPNRVAYTIATSISFGLKGYMFHYGGGVVDSKTGALDALGRDLQKVNAPFASIGEELMEIGNPSAVYSTKVTLSAKDRPTGTDPAVPGGIAEIPAENHFQVKQGEVLLGVFQDEKKNDVVAFSSHNAYQPQNVILELDPKVKKVSLFDRRRGSWKRLKTKKGRVGFQVAVSATELLRVER
jgi:hypothetical protein